MFPLFPFLNGQPYFSLMNDIILRAKPCCINSALTLSPFPNTTHDVKHGSDAKRICEYIVF